MILTYVRPNGHSVGAGFLHVGLCQSRSAPFPGSRFPSSLIIGGIVFFFCSAGLGGRILDMGLLPDTPLNLPSSDYLVPYL